MHHPLEHSYARTDYGHAFLVGRVLLVKVRFPCFGIYSLIRFFESGNWSNTENTDLKLMKE